MSVILNNNEINEINHLKNILCIGNLYFNQIFSESHY